MANPLILAPTVSDSATITANNEVASQHPVANLRLVQPTRKWHTNDLTGPFEISLDFGEAKSFNAFYLGTSNASAEATWRIRAATSVANLDTSPLLASDFGEMGTALRFVDNVDSATATDAGLSAVGTFTLEALVTPSALELGGIVGHMGGATERLLWMDASGFIVFAEPDGTGSVTSLAALTVDVPVRISGVYDTTANEAKLYVDGTLQGTTSSVTADSNGTTIVIAPSQGGERFAGRIDDVRLWDDVRTQPEINTNKNLELTGGEADLLHYWNLNEGNGAVGEDSAGTDDMAISSSVLWAFPDRFWQSPGLDDWGRTQGLYFGATVSARYARIDICDPNNPDGYFRAGRVVVGLGWQPASLGREYRGTLGHVDPSVVTEMPSGSRMIRRADIRTKADFTLISSSESEFLSNAYELGRTRGISKDVVVSLDPADATFAAHKTIHGLFSDAGEVVFPNVGLYRKRFTIEELV